MFVFEHNKRPYPWPLLCPVCQTMHKVKTYHIPVDADGFSIVSVDIWETMKKNSTAGFQVANEVTAPPAQQINLGVAVPHPEIING